MGAYVYKVTSKRVKLSDGGEANLAKYAYKPSWSYDGDKFNAKMEFRTGCHTANRMAEAGKYTGRMVMEETPGADVYSFGAGTFVDDSFKWAERKVEGVTVA